VSLNSNEFDDLSEICEYFNYWCFLALGHLILVQLILMIQKIKASEMLKVKGLKRLLGAKIGNSHLRLLVWQG